MIDTTIINHPNGGRYLLQQWNIKCNDKNNNGKIIIFVNSTKTNFPTGDPGSTSIPPIGDSFLCIEPSLDNQ